MVEGLLAFFAVRNGMQPVATSVVQRQLKPANGAPEAMVEAEKWELENADKCEVSSQGVEGIVFDNPGTRRRVFQFVWELKLRCFTAEEILEQELRKDVEDRVFLKLLQPRSMEELERRTHRGAAWGLLRFVNGTMPAFARLAQRWEPLLWLGALLRGAGQLMLCNNPISGLFVVAALFAASSWTACMALLGLVCSTVAGVMLGVNRAAWRGGLFGYNGFAFGAAMATYMPGPWNPLTIPIVFVGSLFVTILNLAFGNMLAPIFGVPPLTMAFVVTVWILLGAMTGWHNFSFPAGAAAHFPGPKPGEVTFDVGLAFHGWLRGVGQIGFAGTTWSGVLLVVGAAFYSRISAVMLLAGSMVGLLAGWCAGVDVQQLYAGLYGFNAALTALCVGGLFFVISRKIIVLAMMAAWLATWLHSALSQWLAPVGLPATTAGFVITTIFFIMVQFSLSGIAAIPLARVGQPEDHYYKTRRLAAMLRALAKIEAMKAEVV